MELGARDAATPGKLALCRGYASLERLNGEPYDDPAAAHGCGARRASNSSIAAREMPDDPAPHLALARLYVYSLPNVEKAMAEFAAAQLLGAAMGRREIEQQADAYRMRAELEAGANAAAGLAGRADGARPVRAHRGFDRWTNIWRARQAASGTARAKARRSRRWR